MLHVLCKSSLKNYNHMYYTMDFFHPLKRLQKQRDRNSDKNDRPGWETTAEETTAPVRGTKNTDPHFPENAL